MPSMAYNQRQAKLITNVLVQYYSDLLWEMLVLETPTVGNPRMRKINRFLNWFLYLARIYSSFLDLIV